MKRCSTCFYDNQQTSVYCERCGTFLDPISAPFEPTLKPSDETLIPPPPPPPLSSYQHSQGIQTQTTSQKRTVGGTILSVVLCVWGTFVLTVGLVGGFFYFIQSNPVIFLLLYLFISLMFLVPLLLFRTHMHLKWGKRLALEIGLLVIGVILIIIVYEAVQPMGDASPTSNHLIGGSLILYGLATSFVAFW